MASILSFVKSRDESFDPETVRLMGEVFDAACKALSPAPDDREAIATRIFNAAAGGERDPERLLQAALRTRRR